MNHLTIEQIASIREQIRQELKPSRYEHTLGVAYTAACMGMVWGEDLLTCELAGLLHDCAKNTSDEELVDACRQAGIPLTEEELASPQILHAIYGAYLVPEKYGIFDDDVINAVRYHTTGRPSMSLLEKIIFISDFIEPLRYHQNCLKDARHLAFKDIDRCMYLILEDTIEFLNHKGIHVESSTIETYNYYKAFHERRGVLYG